MEKIEEKIENPSQNPNTKKRKVCKMNLSLSCLVTLSYSLSHSISCAFYKFVVRDDVISPAGVRNFGTYDDVFEHVHGVKKERSKVRTSANHPKIVR